MPPQVSPPDKELVAVRKKVLGGREVPDELAALWVLERDAFFRDPDYGEVTLLAVESDLAHHYIASAEDEAWESLFKEVAWVAAEADGGIIGTSRTGSRSPTPATPSPTPPESARERWPALDLGHGHVKSSSRPSSVTAEHSSLRLSWRHT